MDARYYLLSVSTVTGAARVLGIHRNVLRRLMVHHGIEPSQLPGIVAAHRTTRGRRGPA